MRDKLVFFFRKLALLFFLLMFVYVGLMVVFGEGIFPGKYIAIIFFISFLFWVLTFLPPKLDKENFYNWLFFISLLLALIPFIVVYFSQVFHLFVLSQVLTIILLISFFLGFIGVIIFPSSKTSSRKEIKLNVVNSFNEVVAKLGLTTKDLSTDKLIILKAEGKHKIGYLKLEVQFSFGYGFSKIADKSIISIKTLKEIKPPPKIEVFRGAIKVENLNEPQESRIINFIKEKQLDYFDFTLSTIGDEIIINVNNQIEETDLWLDFITLIEMLLE